jgi:hypothetical protein
MPKGFLFSRRQTPRETSNVIDHRSGEPIRREPTPMPRLRWPT